MSTIKTNPSTYLGGTWVAWGAGCVPVGVDTSQTEFSSVEKTGGAKTVTLTTNQIPAHRHYLNNSNADGGTVNYTIAYAPSAKGFAGTLQTAATGGGAAHNNLQPYITCYMFKRTA